MHGYSQAHWLDTADLCHVYLVSRRTAQEQNYKNKLGAAS